jgi:hypothetical protein
VLRVRLRRAKAQPPPAAPAPLRGWGTWLLARNAGNVAGVPQQVDGRGASYLRLPGQLIGPRAGLTATRGPGCGPGGGIPWPRGRNALRCRREWTSRDPGYLAGRPLGHLRPRVSAPARMAGKILDGYRRVSSGRRPPLAWSQRQ